MLNLHSRRFLSISCLCLLLVLAVIGQAGAAPEQATGNSLPQIAFQKYMLKNGMDVILHHSAGEHNRR
jgi:hypothetical protein